MAEPRDIVVNGNGTATSQYVLPGAVFQYVESIFVTVDNTGGANPVRPTLTIENGSGVVIAAKRQGGSIPVADTGTATWALRLTDEAPSGGGGGGKLGVYTSFGLVVSTGTTTAFPFAYDRGDPLLDVTVADRPRFVAAGAYTVRLFVYSAAVINFPGKVGVAGLDEFAFGFDYATSVYQNVPLDTEPGGMRTTVTTPMVGNAGNQVVGSFDHNAGVNVTVNGVLVVMQIA